jgi:hypothetical protein
MAGLGKATAELARRIEIRDLTSFDRHENKSVSLLYVR